MVASPMILRAGVNTTLAPPTITAVPLVAVTLVIVRLSPSTSLSLSNGLIVTGTSSAVLALSSTATGASFTALTVTVISAEFVPPLPSLIVYPIVAVPLKLVAGVNTTLVPPTITAVPLVAVTLVIVRLSPSTSLSLSNGLIVTGTSSAVLALSSTATGASFTALTVTVISAEFVPPLPSLIVYPIVAVPLKLVAGVNTTLVPPTITAVPLVAVTLVIVRLSPSTSLSLSNGLIVTGTSSAVLALSSTATGASFTALTVTVISAEFVPPLPSLIVYPIVAVPLKLVAGVNTTLVPPTITAVPLVAVTLVIVRLSPSTSLSLSNGLIVTGTSSAVLALSSTATGASFTALTVTVISAEAVPPLPSLIVYPIVAVPLKLVAGVNSTLVPPTITAVPLVAVTLVIVRLSPSTSLSLSNGLIVTGTSSAVLALSSTATGGSFTALTVTVISAEVVPPLPSLIVYPIVAVPLKLVAGVNTTLVPPTITAVPLVGVTLVIVRLSPSTSLSLSRALMVTGTSSAVLAASSSATGGSFTGLTVTVISADAVPPLPSLML